MKIDYSNIKLVIWDLDDTFWDGILSEESVRIINSNIELVKMLADCGIVSTICSKNDAPPVLAKLKEAGVEDYFVFPSINWQPKGQRIRQLIRDMGLRAANCLFVDDNIANLNEARHYSQELMVAEPEILTELKRYFGTVTPTDTAHKRLQQYKVLERKQAAKASASDNLSFLYESNIQVEICNDSLAEIDRIHELVNRTNQLNYTKLRCTRKELEELLSEKDVKSGYVKVKDKYGDYGIVGFYALKGNTLIHFLFSCRTIGQGVEQYVYASLGHPYLSTVGEVVNAVTRDATPAWINQKTDNEERKGDTIKGIKVLFKGGCDLWNMTVYLNTSCVIEEFSYIGQQRCNIIENNYHTTNLLYFPFLSAEEREQMVRDYIFADIDMFDSVIYDKDLTIAFIGMMTEPHLGIYRNKVTGRRIAFGENRHPLTNTDEWDNYIDGTIFNATNHFTREWLQWFADNHEFLGALSPEQILQEYKEMLALMSPTARLCILLGSETPFEKEQNECYFGREKVYKSVNDLLREWASEEERVLILDYNKYIHGQEDFTSNINHFQRRVYYNAANEANRIIADIAGVRIRQKSRLYLFVRELADYIGKTGFCDTRLWHLIRKPYVVLREKL